MALSGCCASLISLGLNGVRFRSFNVGLGVAMWAAVAVAHWLLPFGCSLAAPRVASRTLLGTHSVQSLI